MFVFYKVLYSNLQISSVCSSRLMTAHWEKTAEAEWWIWKICFCKKNSLHLELFKPTGCQGLCWIPIYQSRLETVKERTDIIYYLTQIMIFNTEKHKNTHLYKVYLTQISKARWHLLSLQNLHLMGKQIYSCSSDLQMDYNEANSHTIEVQPGLHFLHMAGDWTGCRIGTVKISIF